MKDLVIFIICLLAFPLLKAQNYNFNGTISREVLDNYLERAITMQGQSEIEGVLMLSETERLRNIDMLDDLEAKFIGRIGGWWENGWGQTNHDNFFDMVEQNVQDVKANDPDVICQAAVFEYVSATIETFWIPDYVWNEFGFYGNQIPTNHRLNYSDMLYSDGRYVDFWNPNASVPDITQVATQMWFYYMATRYISVGCEAIHFGQAEIMNEFDVGNKEYWQLLQRIRTYASTRNRGVVICDAHVPSGGMYYEPTLNMSVAAWENYTYPYGWQKQLLWDFHSIWVGYEEASGCTSNLQPVTVNPDPNRGLHQRSLGGRSPQGWYAVSNPYLVELDNGDVGTAVGCNSSPAWMLYGWDEISWFGEQPEYYRNRILKYTHYKIKCMDKNGHLIMPGLRGVTPGNGNPNYLYRANTGFHNQQVTIKNIWNNVLPSPENWVRHDFSDAYVSNSPNPGIADKNLVHVGNNRMYYIGTDQRVHGYIKYGDTWLTTSPSYAAGNINQQQKAAGDLVANPSGTYLYYRGTNGLIYRYKINNDWSYTYSAMPTNSAMQQQNISAMSSLICPTDNRIYYIAKENASGHRRIHGFIKYGSTWLTTSPSWSAHSNGFNINNQQKAALDLTINPSGTDLYYIGIDGLVYRYKINNDWSYTYSAMPTNTAMQQQKLQAFGSLICPKDNRLYYIAYEKNNGWKRRVHGFIKYGSTWLTTSPSWSAHSNGFNINNQQTTNNKLVCSPDNKTIAYLGSDSQLYGFNINNDWSYSFITFNKTPTNKTPRESLVFNSNNDLYYIASIFGDNKVHFFRYGYDHCENDGVQIVEPSCCIYRMTDDLSSENPIKSNLPQLNQKNQHRLNIQNTSFKIILSPNPAYSDNVSLSLEDSDEKLFKDEILSISIFDLNGKVLKNEEVIYTPAPINLNISDLANGVYLISVKSKIGISVEKLIISR